MARKNSPGCYCCQCEEIDVTTLPDITIPGYTQQGTWGGSPCCPCLTFKKDNPVWSCSLSPVIATQERKMNYEYEQWVLPAPAPRVAYCESLDPEVVTPVGGSTDTCCQGAAVLLANVAFSWKEKASYRIKAKTRPDTITVCISHLDVECDNEPIGKKWVVKTTFCYNAIIDVVADVYYKFDCDVTNFTNPCFTAHPPDSCESNYLASCENETDPVKCGLHLGDLCFTRVKLYNTLPEGDVTFTNIDTPEECTWGYCENPAEYFDAFCFTVTSNSDCIKNCMCLETLQNPVFEDYTFQKLSDFCCTFCEDVIARPRGKRWNCCPEPPTCDTLAATFCQECTVTDCGSITASRANPVITPPSHELCDSYESHKNNWNIWFGGFGGFNTCTGFTIGGSLSIFKFFPPQVYFSINACDEQNSDCCWYCECNGEKVSFFPKWGASISGAQFAFTNATLFSYSWDCDGVSDQSYCLNAPIWTVNFS